MRMKEAKDLFMAADCSYFTMCNMDYPNYMEYRRLELTREQEDIWRNERLAILYQEFQKKGESRLFRKMYDIAAEFHDHEKLHLMCDALKFIKTDLEAEERVSIAETILGRKAQKVRSGLVYWAYDSGQRGMAILFIDTAIQMLDISHFSRVELERRYRKVRRLCTKIIDELNFNVNFMRFE